MTDAKGALIFIIVGEGTGDIISYFVPYVQWDLELGIDD